MNMPAKLNVLQTYQVVLYDRAVHPTAVPLKARKVYAQGDYELEAWVMPGAHALRFDYRKNACVTELLTDHERGMPTAGVFKHFLCAGEHEIEEHLPGSGVVYLASIQTETLSDNLFAETYNEMLELARANSALAHRWEEAGARCLSVVDVQRYKGEVHAQTYHLLGSIGLVLRTQTIFEVPKAK